MIKDNERCAPVNGYDYTPWEEEGWQCAFTHTQACSLLTWTLLIVSLCLLRAVDGLVSPQAPLPNGCQVTHECLSLWVNAIAVHAAQTI